MNILLASLLLFLSSIAYADYNVDRVVLSGKVISFNDNYVTLLTPNNIKTYAPKKYFSDYQLRSENQTTVFVSFEDYQHLVRTIKKIKDK